MIKRFFYMPQIYDMGRKMHYGFLLIEAWFEPMNLGFNGKHSTTGPPRETSFWTLSSTIQWNPLS
jgi:hypothetical protein